MNGDDSGITIEPFDVNEYDFLFIVDASKVLFGLNTEMELQEAEKIARMLHDFVSSNLNIRKFSRVHMSARDVDGLPDKDILGYPRSGFNVRFSVGISLNITTCRRAIRFLNSIPKFTNLPENEYTSTFQLYRISDKKYLTIPRDSLQSMIGYAYMWEMYIDPPKYFKIERDRLLELCAALCDKDARVIRPEFTKMIKKLVKKDS